jgi:hypothetical protein
MANGNSSFRVELYISIVPPASLHFGSRGVALAIAENQKELDSSRAVQFDDLASGT